jgi:hypothetical protein
MGRTAMSSTTLDNVATIATKIADGELGVSQLRAELLEALRAAKEEDPTLTYSDLGRAARLTPQRVHKLLHG